MIDKQNRLWKLLRKVETFEEFMSKAIARSAWYLRPYASAGINVNRPWIENFWMENKGV